MRQRHDWMNSSMTPEALEQKRKELEESLDHHAKRIQILCWVIVALTVLLCLLAVFKVMEG